MSIAVMLSVPIPSSVSTAIISENISSTGFEIFFLEANVLLCLSTLVWSVLIQFSLERQSQIPSQASIINLSSLVLSVIVISGLDVTA